MDSMNRQPASRPRLLDGGTGSELRRRGVTLSRHCWSAEANITQPDIVRRIHEDYIDAGADIVTANTFATSRFVLADAGLDNRFEPMNRSALDAAKQAVQDADRRVAVAASLSCLPPSFDQGRYPDAETEYRDYVEQTELFARHGAELILVEMMQHPDHAARACRAARASGLPFWVGLSCRIHPASGEIVAFDDAAQSIASVVDAVTAFDPTGIAIMHSPTEVTGPALEMLEAHWSGRTGAWAEIPYPQDAGNSKSEPIAPEAYAESCRDWLTAGAQLVGGCCGTTPAHIRALSRLVSR